MHQGWEDHEENISNLDRRSDFLQVTPPVVDKTAVEMELMDSSSDLEGDYLRSTLGKK